MRWRPAPPAARLGAAPAPRRRRAPWRDARGAAAVELALVLPVLLLFVLGIIHFGSLFYLHNTMVTVAQDLARRVAIGEVTETQAQTMAAERLASWSATFAVTVTEPTVDDIVLAITVPIQDVALVDFAGLPTGGSLTAEAQMRKEAW